MTNLKSILKLQPQFWKDLSVKIRTWIWEDMENGKVQEMTGKNYYSLQYAKYKANYMNRFTIGGTLTSTYAGKKRKGAFGIIDIVETKRLTGSRKRGSGTKLKSFSGQSVVSNWVSSVNMLLTSQTIRGLIYKSSNDNSMVIGYQLKDADKILGNEALGRDIRTLNDKNKDKTLKLLEDEFSKNIRDWERERIVIKINSK